MNDLSEAMNPKVWAKDVFTGEGKEIKSLCLKASKLIYFYNESLVKLSAFGHPTPAFLRKEASCIEKFKKLQSKVDKLVVFATSELCSEPSDSYCKIIQTELEPVLLALVHCEAMQLQVIGWTGSEPCNISYTKMEVARLLKLVEFSMLLIKKNN